MGIPKKHYCFQDDTIFFLPVLVQNNGNSQFLTIVNNFNDFHFFVFFFAKMQTHECLRQHHHDDHCCKDTVQLDPFPLQE